MGARRRLPFIPYALSVLLLSALRVLQEEVIRQGQGNVELWGAEGRRKLVQGNGDMYSIQMRSLAITIIDFIPDLVWQYALHTRI